MRVLLDECVDARLADRLAAYDVQTVPQVGWRTLEDVPLLAAAQDRIDVFVTIDKSIEHQQNWRRFSFAVLILHVPRNEIVFYEPLLKDLRDAIESARPGQVVHIRGERSRRF